MRRAPKQVRGPTAVLPYRSLRAPRGRRLWEQPFKDLVTAQQAMDRLQTTAPRVPMLDMRKGDDGNFELGGTGS